MELTDTSLKTGKLTEFVGNDDYPLQLRIGELRALQAEVGVGPSALLNRLQFGEWTVDDVIETIRLALIGGGMSQKDAKKLVTHYITDGYLVDYSLVALRCMFATMHGNPEDAVPPGETTDQAMTTPDA